MECLFKFIELGF